MQFIVSAEYFKSVSNLMSVVISIGKTCVALGEDVFEKIKNQVKGFDQCEAFTSAGFSDVLYF